MFRQRRIWFGAATFVALLVSAGWFYRQHQRFPHFAEHDPEMVFRAGALEPDAITELIETHQIRTVVCFRPMEDTGDAERTAVAGSGARFITEPDSTSTDPRDPSIIHQIEILRDPNNYPLLVHSQSGVYGTARFLSIYDIVFRGMSADESLKSLPRIESHPQYAGLQAFAKSFELRHRELYPSASADDLKILR